MDPLIGAVLAAAVAWLSIVTAALFPVPLDLGWLRRLGAVSLALLGLAAFGLPVPGFLPVAVLVVGLGLALAAPRLRKPAGQGLVP
jgi:hypothetical protein